MYIVKFLDKKILDLIMWYMNKKLKQLRKSQDTPYIHIKGTEKQYPNYLMYTDNVDIRNKMHAID